MEKCGFVFHVILFPLGIFYLTWISYGVLVSSATHNKEEHDASFLGRLESLSVVIPTILVLLFIAAPLVYFLLNTLSVPSVTHPEGIDWDALHKKRRTRMHRTEHKSQGKNQVCGVPEVETLDVAIINDLVYENMMRTQRCN